MKTITKQLALLILLFTFSSSLFAQLLEVDGRVEIRDVTSRLSFFDTDDNLYKMYMREAGGNIFINSLRGDLLFSASESGGAAIGFKLDAGTNMISLGGGHSPETNLHLRRAGEVGIKVESTSSNAYMELNKGTGTTDWRFLLPTAGYIAVAFSSDEFATSTNRFAFWKTSFRPLSDGNISLGTMSNRWSTVYAQNGTINTSDRRLKDNIQQLNYGIDEIMLLQPVSYSWKSGDPSEIKLGLIAQEVEAVIKEVVVNGSPGFKTDDGVVHDKTDRMGIYYSDLIPVLIKGMQDQQHQIELLESKLDALTSK